MIMRITVANLLVKVKIELILDHFLGVSRTHDEIKHIKIGVLMDNLFV
jgi:hypothetical protein